LKREWINHIKSTMTTSASSNVNMLISPLP
jgi:hypothetical protein